MLQAKCSSSSAVVASHRMDNAAAGPSADRRVCVIQLRAGGTLCSWLARQLGGYKGESTECCGISRKNWKKVVVGQVCTSCTSKAMQGGSAGTFHGGSDQSREHSKRTTHQRVGSIRGSGQHTAALSQACWYKGVHGGTPPQLDGIAIRMHLVTIRRRTAPQSAARTAARPHQRRCGWAQSRCAGGPCGSPPAHPGQPARAPPLRRRRRWAGERRGCGSGGPRPAQHRKHLI